MRPPRAGVSRAVCVAAWVVVTLQGRSSAVADDCALGLSPPRPPAASTERDVASPAERTPTGDVRWGFDLVAGLMLPLSVGGTMILEMPYGLQLRLGGGVVPSPLIDGINDVGEAWALWTPDTASALSQLLVDSIVLEAALGIRPAWGPLEFSVGYVLSAGTTFARRGWWAPSTPR